MSEAKSEMVERVARALFKTEWHPATERHEGKASLDWEREWPNSREYWLESARAAVAAMRDPTQAMTEAASEAVEKYEDEVRGGDLTPTQHCLPETVWRTMIDEALK
jgi:hypothetical protein